MAENVDYTINYDDERFQSVQSEKQQALQEISDTYDSMISKSDQYYQAQIDAANEWGETQKKNQQEQTDFAIEQINQQKEQARKDYTKEQSGAYVDWQKQSGEYGVNAEMMAAQGMTGTGYSESSQVSMYNTYQNRVATARESYQRAVLNYDNSITEARLQNNAALAEIAYTTLQNTLELSLEGFQYKNSLIVEKTDALLDSDNTYYSRYQDVLSQLNAENSLAESVRQYDTSLAEEIRQYNESLAEEKRQYNASLAEKKRQYDNSMAQILDSGDTVEDLGEDTDTWPTRSSTDWAEVYGDKQKIRRASNAKENGVVEKAVEKAVEKGQTIRGNNIYFSVKDSKDAAKTVVQILNNKGITKYEAAYILNRLGHDPSDYLNF